jgi:hypothetical protein
VTASLDAGLAASSSGSYHVQLWSLRPQDFDAATAMSLLSCRSPWALQEGKLTAVKPDSKVCPP